MAPFPSPRRRRVGWGALETAVALRVMALAVASAADAAGNLHVVSQPATRDAALGGRAPAACPSLDDPTSTTSSEAQPPLEGQDEGDEDVCPPPPPPPPPPVPPNNPPPAAGDVPANPPVLPPATSAATVTPPAPITPPEPTTSPLAGFGGESILTPPRLTVVKTGPVSATAGSIVRYRIRVKNVGGATARNVRLSDILPKGTSVGARQLSKLRATSVRISQGSVTWSLGNLAPGATRTVTIALLVGSSGSRLTNVAQAAGVNARSVRATAKTIVKALPD